MRAGDVQYNVLMPLCDVAVWMEDLRPLRAPDPVHGMDLDIERARYYAIFP
jgi:hypothetical protein